jgi:hypothetical protein
MEAGPLCGAIFLRFTILASIVPALVPAAALAA